LLPCYNATGLSERAGTAAATRTWRSRLPASLLRCSRVPFRPDIAWSCKSTKRHVFLNATLRGSKTKSRHAC